MLLDFSTVCQQASLSGGSVADSASSQYGSSPPSPVPGSPGSSARAPFGDEGSAASVMGDDSAHQLPGLEEAGAGAEADSQLHPWLAPKWRQHVQRTAHGLLRLTVQRGCTATAAWLLQLLRDLGEDVQEALCQVGPGGQAAEEAASPGALAHMFCSGGGSHLH